jgi:peptidoglycan hydrolase-like protein with peptidoglycan-binding domain/ubiquinone/menaquinone biosynthesis C-methylase UbiE
VGAKDPGHTHPVFAALYDLATAGFDRRLLGPERRRLIGACRGRVLELGAGTGASFADWRAAERAGRVSLLCAVEPDVHMRRRAEARARRLGLEVDLRAGVAEHLPFPDAAFDAVASFLVLCSVDDPAAALREARRVLRPGGLLAFMEHVRADGAAARWQRGLNPVWSPLAGGCRLDRDTAGAIAEAGFADIRLRALAVPFPLCRLVLGTAARGPPCARVHRGAAPRRALRHTVDKSDAGEGNRVAAFEDALPYHAWGSRYLELASPEMRGTDVKVFQTLFNDFLQHSAPPQGPLGTPIAVDGIFGPQTAGAVRNWQSYFGLTVDGVIGPETGDTLGQFDGAYGGPRFGSRALVPGVAGGDVWVLQNRLNCYEYGQRMGPADGSFGAGTADAVLHFQQTMDQGLDPGVPQDGLVRFETFDALWAYTYVGGRGLFEGRNGIDVLWVQRFLASLGLYSGARDGYFGPVTRRGVVSFQQAAGIAADGVVGPVTMKQIGRAFPVPAATWP